MVDIGDELQDTSCDNGINSVRFRTGNKAKDFQVSLYYASLSLSLERGRSAADLPKEGLLQTIQRTAVDTAFLKLRFSYGDDGDKLS